MPKEKYTIHRLWRKGWWRCEDTEHGITLDWQEHQFNEQNEARMTKEAREAVKGEHPELIIANWLQDMCEWLRENHPEKLF